MSVSTVGVIGAGAMGSGIAQVAATKGIDVILLDVSENAVKTGIDAVERRLSAVVTKGKITPTEKDAALRLAAMALAEQLGKSPVTVKSAPGFVVNRILLPMINEAFFVLAEGYASAEDIDKGMKFGCNHPIGPLALADMIGLDVLLSVMQILHDEFADSKYRPCPLLKELVAAGHLGRKSGRGVFTY